ncbi:TPA: hypothetical protein ACGPKD_003851 [Escherichia coli]|uniref:hypothetical protein n=1 Tax=Enterobacteriaceae TaxID=543 RepID=UPI0004050FF9|nr:MULTISPECIES: hypothetical protein [Enterobacteriaceae]EHK3067749.1 hypothetical protein [Escherichia fergusonii]HAX0171210.1 hypothetical protein [Escherichia coli MVAST084]EFB5439234.1 hypothetical protein [Escherichia coli]EFE7076017.1 hypothetical protein [Escherichia coli]EFH3625512.1 hypothetical protein [Escherichia coli]
MNQVHMNVSGLMELLESNLYRADALAAAVRLNLESTSASLYAKETIYNIDTLRQLLDDAKTYHEELAKQLRGQTIN